MPILTVGRVVAGLAPGRLISPSRWRHGKFCKMRSQMLKPAMMRISPDRHIGVGFLSGQMKSNFGQMGNIGFIIGFVIRNQIQASGRHSGSIPDMIKVHFGLMVA